MIFYKKHDEVVAMADEDVLGKEFEEGKLYIKVSELFYKGEKVSDERAVAVMREAHNLNLVGKKVVELAKREGICSDDDVLMIQGVPHVQVCHIFESK